MNDPGFLADILAVAHAAYVLFVVAGQGLIIAGWIAHWAWTRNPWFRWLHLGAIGIVVLEVAVGAYCPLTLIESDLRRRAGSEGYGEPGFIGYWVDRLLYYDIPLWQAHVAYVIFAVLVAWTFWRYPPRRCRRRDDGGSRAC